MALTSSIVLALLLITGTAISGILFTLFFRARPITTEESQQEPSPVDSSNPYQPSNISTRVVGSRLGCGMVGVVHLVLAGVMLLAILTLISIKASRIARPTTTTVPK